MKRTALEAHHSGLESRIPVPTKGAGPFSRLSPGAPDTRAARLQGQLPHPGSRGSTDLLEGAGEEVDQRAREDQGKHPPLPQEPAPHHSRQVHHPGRRAGPGPRRRSPYTAGSPMARGGRRPAALNQLPSATSHLPRDSAPRTASSPLASPAGPHSASSSLVPTKRGLLIG